jgi:ABC-type multidrug transport system fused ATPase/permease subunit
MIEPKQERLCAFQRQQERLRRSIERLDTISNRYSWIRVAIFFGGLALSVVMGFISVWWFGLLLAVLALLCFSIVAHYQGKIDRSITRHRIWLRIKTTHVARMQLDWDNIPQIHTWHPLPDHPFETDLDITGERSIHQLLNTAVSREGSQRLRDWLLTTQPDLATIQQRQALVRELVPMTRFRDKLTLNSMLASRRAAEHLEGDRLLRWLAQPSPSHSLIPLMLVSSSLTVLTIILLLLSLVANCPQYWLLSLLCSAVLFYSTGKQRGEVFEDAYYLRDAFATLSTVFAYLEHYPYGEHEQLKQLCTPFFAERRCRPSLLLRHIARIATIATLEKNQFLRLIVNVLLPVETYAAHCLRHYKVQVADYLPTWLNVWYELEALCSLATFAYLNPAYMLPDVRGNEREALFSGRSLGHPLLPDEKKVLNDFTMHALGDVVIITGSNMSGKSTFLRTVGVNLCLAYAGSVVNAEAMRIALFRLFTCIRVSDSVIDGYSYFYAEVRRLKTLLLALHQRDQFPLFFLIDEIFKGTNNRERLIGGRSYVRALAGHRCLGIISTHDLELVKLAETSPHVSNKHFREDVIDGRMVFDYKLRPGPSPTTNALTIMRMEGLPIEE